MAEFKDIALGFNRMCNFYNVPPCEGCPMGFHTIDRSDCMSRLFCNPEKYEERVIKWVEKHPEPKYPTWAEWLSGLGLIVQRDGTFTEYSLDGVCCMTKKVDALSEKAYQPILNDIAEKLGLNPKEV